MQYKRIDLLNNDFWAANGISPHLRANAIIIVMAHAFFGLNFIAYGLMSNDIFSINAGTISFAMTALSIAEDRKSHRRVSNVIGYCELLVLGCFFLSMADSFWWMAVCACEIIFFFLVTRVTNNIIGRLQYKIMEKKRNTPQMKGKTPIIIESYDEQLGRLLFKDKKQKTMIMVLFYIFAVANFISTGVYSAELAAFFIAPGIITFFVMLLCIWTIKLKISEVAFSCIVHLVFCLVLAVKISLFWMIAYGCEVIFCLFVMNRIKNIIIIKNEKETKK